MNIKHENVAFWYDASDDRHHGLFKGFVVPVAAGIRAVGARYSEAFGTNESGAEFDIGGIYEVVGIIRKENGVAA